MRVYTFGNGRAEGSAEMVTELGGKGAGLADMCQIGLPVPPGFTISAAACRLFFQADQTFPDALAEEIERGVRHSESLTGQCFSGAQEPLLVSVRSGLRSRCPA